MTPGRRDSLILGAAPQPPAPGLSMLGQIWEIHVPKGIEVVGIGVDSAVKISNS